MTHGKRSMSLDQHVASFDRSDSWSRAVAPCLFAGLLLGFIGIVEGAPTFAALLSTALMTGLGAAMHMMRRASLTHPWGRRVHHAAQNLRALSKPTQLL